MSSAAESVSGGREDGSPAGWMPTLARLAFVRALSWVVLALIVAVLALARWIEAGNEVELGSWLGERAPDAGAGVRHALWSVAAFVVVPLFVARATISFQRWRAGELDFLAPRAASRLWIVVATWIGHVVALAAALALVALAAELGTGERETWADRGAVRLDASEPRSGNEHGAWIRGSEPWNAQLTLPVGTDVRRVSVEFALAAGGGPAAEIEMRASRLPPAIPDAIAHRQRLGTRGVLEFELPEGGGPFEIELRLADRETRVFLISSSARAWSPDAEQRRASVELFARLWLVGAALSAFALAASAFVSATIATSGALALWLVPSVVDSAPVWWPGSDLDLALDSLARGRVPLPAPAVSAVATLLFAGAVLAFAAAMRGPWRRSR